MSNIGLKTRNQNETNRTNKKQKKHKQSETSIDNLNPNTNKTHPQTEKQTKII